MSIKLSDPIIRSQCTHRVVVATVRLTNWTRESTRLKTAPSGSSQRSPSWKVESLLKRWPKSCSNRARRSLPTAGQRWNIFDDSVRVMRRERFNAAAIRFSIPPFRQAAVVTHEDKLRVRTQSTDGSIESVLIRVWSPIAANPLQSKGPCKVQTVAHVTEQAARWEGTGLSQWSAVITHWTRLVRAHFVPCNRRNQCTYANGLYFLFIYLFSNELTTRC